MKRRKAPEGILIRHRTERSKMIVVECPRAYAEPLLCPTCRIAHPLKAVHLWLDDAGRCIVSEGVLDDLRQAGMPGLQVVTKVKNPPMLTIGHKVDRAEVDYRNRSQTIYRLDGFNTQ